MARRKLVAGNWKMNGRLADLDWIPALADALQDRPPACDFAVCPPATLLKPFADRLPTGLELGAQDCSAHKPDGAHTGEVSAAMLADIGCSFVILGHSERRAAHGETDDLVRAKAEAALAAGLTPIICLGETLDQREAGRAEAVAVAQLRASVPPAAAEDLVIAYEPVWAIGTGLTADPAAAQAMHGALRAAWPGDDRAMLRVVYGGSVKPENAAALMAQPDIDGALVGGACLDAHRFAAIVNACR